MEHVNFLGIKANRLFDRKFKLKIRGIESRMEKSVVTIH